MNPSRRRRSLLLVVAVIASTLTFVTGGPASARMASAVPEVPEIVGRACDPGEGVTIVADFRELDPDAIRVGCAEGEQANGIEALVEAGFTIDDDAFDNGTICQIEGLPVEGYPTCWFDGFWGYWKTEDGDWSWSDVGAGNGPLPVDTVEAWSWTDEIDEETYEGPPPRISLDDVVNPTAPSTPDCTAIPQLPAITILHRDEVLPVTLADGGDVEVALVDEGADPADADHRILTELSLADESGPTRVVARRAGDDCPDAPIFDFTYDVRDAYAPRRNSEGAGAPSPAVERTSEDIIGWATGWENYVPGPNVSASFQNPDNAIGGGGGLVVLGDRGEITLTFEDPIVDRPGYDLAVFENGFEINGPNELDFLEFAYVEVSSNGTDFVRFDSGSRQTDPVGSFAGQRANLVGGLAGKDLKNWGTPFDLAALANKPSVRSGLVDLDAITHVRLVDVTGDGDDLDSFGRPIHDPHPTSGSGGFDLEGVAVLDQTPTDPPCAVDGSGGTDAALDWLACEIDRSGGHLPNFSGGPDHGLTLDAILAFAIHDRTDDPAAVAALDTIFEDVRDYTTDAAWGDGEGRTAGAIAKVLLAGLLMDADVTDVDGLDLEVELRGLLATDGPDEGRFSDRSSHDGSNGFGQTLAMLALSRTEEGVPEASVDFLLDQQCPNGGFRGAYNTPGGCTDDGAADPDYTAMAIAALDTAVQTTEVRTAIDDGANWLVSKQGESGGISGHPVFSPAENTNTSGIGAQALRSVGRTDAADAAADWVFGLQIVDGQNGDLADHLGAIAFTRAAFDDAIESGLPDQRLDQWRRATAQAVLVTAPSFGVAGDDPPIDEPRDAAESWILALHEDLLDRAATEAEIDAIRGRLDGGTPKRTIARELSATPEWVSTIVTRFYRDTLDRDPDAAGLAYWVDQIRTGKRTVANVAADFYSSGEYHARVGGTAEAWVTALYDALLHRAPDAPGLDHWVRRTAARGRRDVARSFYASAESRRDRVETLYRALLGRSADAEGRNHWAGRIATEGDLALAVHLTVSAEYQAKANIRFP